MGHIYEVASTQEGEWMIDLLYFFYVYVIWISGDHLVLILDISKVICQYQCMYEGGKLCMMQNNMFQYVEPRF